MPEISEAELKQKIDEAVEAATAPLLSKNKELLNEKKALQRGQTIDPAEMQALEAQLDKALADNKALNDSFKKLQKDHELVAQTAKTESDYARNLLVSNELAGALGKANVPPHYQSAVKAMLTGKVEVVADGNNRVAKIDGKPLSEFVTAWASSDEGKHFVSAPQNSGGGVSVGGGKPAGQTMSRAQFDALPAAEKSTFAKSGGTLTQ